MNLQPVPIQDIPLNKPLPWRLYDRNCYIIFARGEMVTNRAQLERLLGAGLFRDADAVAQTHEAGDWVEFKDILPGGIFPPTGIQPQVGDRMQLRLVNRSLQTYYSVRLVGYIKNLSILVTTPMVAENPLILMDGELVEVRMLTGNNICAFQASIQRLCISPAHYMHLEYPAEVRVQHLRKSAWARVSIGAAVTNAKGVREVARIVNLSPDGAQLHAPATLGEAGMVLRLSLHAAMDELKTTLILDGTILHVLAPENVSEGEANMLEYSVAFHHTSEADSLWLRGLVYRHIAEGHTA